ncbi:hypothetical protein COCON_G00001930 [Conger conger]|uniref:Lipid droplet-associated hydrolase n=1 Tax=Conger conger TaxID=82655 RepID=A0A9Q1I7D2_CONCO|nr:hypothetical protein COCON_G00001930 [Conger conger]
MFAFGYSALPVAARLLFSERISTPLGSVFFHLKRKKRASVLNGAREMGPPGSEDGCVGCEGCTEHLYCGGAATEVLKFGARDLHPASRLHSSPGVVFLLIPGNPGLVGFYRTFMQTIHEAFGRRHPVWAVSHAGHCVPPDSMRTTADCPRMQIDDVFGLNGQVEHKLAFLREHVPRDAKLVLIGHSIGCYIILEMMKRDPELQVVKSVLLFPTIERMAATPQGRVMTPMLCRLRYVAYVPVFLLSLLPRAVKAALVKIALRAVDCLDLSIVPATLSLFNMDCAANGMYMGGQEMRQVLGRDDPTIRQNLDKLIFYYGATDRWCPVQYYQDIRADFPSGNIQLCGKGYRHAFVLDAGREVAAMVTEWVRDAVENS